MQKKLFKKLCLVAPFVSALVIMNAITCAAWADELIKIGVSLPLSGGAASYGVDMKNALEFANNRLGGGKYKLIFEDDKCDPKASVSIARNFIEIQKIRYVLGFACSGSVLAASALYEKSKTILISSGASASDISSAGEYIFRTIPSDKQAAVKLLNHIALKHSKIGILSEETDFCLGIQQSFSAANQDNRLKIIEQSYLSDTSDFRSLLLKLKNQGIEALIINSQSEATLITSYKQLRDLGITLPVYGFYFVGTDAFLKVAKDSANGIEFVDVPSPEEFSDAEGHAVYKEYLKQYGQPNSMKLLILSSYEAFRALTEAISSGQDAKNYLNQATFKGTYGNWKFDKNGDIIGLEHVIRVIKDRQPVLR